VKFLYIKRGYHNRKYLLLVAFQCVPVWAYFLEAAN